MRKINILYSLFIILLLPACYEDLGSYDYHAINTLEVDSFLPIISTGMTACVFIPSYGAHNTVTRTVLLTNGKSVLKLSEPHTI